MIKRQVKKVYGYGVMFRVMKSYDGKNIRVVQHNEIAPNEYDLMGFVRDEYPATGRFPYALKDVVRIYKNRYPEVAA